MPLVPVDPLKTKVLAEIRETLHLIADGSDYQYCIEISAFPELSLEAYDCFIKLLEKFEQKAMGAFENLYFSGYRSKEQLNLEIDEVFSDVPDTNYEKMAMRRFLNGGDYKTPLLLDYIDNLESFVTFE